MSSNKYNFNGKVALVSGSSSGIGAAIAIQLAQYGARVIITGRDAASLAKVAQQIEKVSNGVSPLQLAGDLLDHNFIPKLINETVSKFGQLDVLVNNAGAASPSGDLASPSLLDEFDKVFQLNVRSVVELTQLAVPHLEKTKGNVINISSVCGLKPYPSCLVYCSSKAALDMITKTSALELGPKGIRVNSIKTGLIRTEFLRSIGFEQKEQRVKYYDDAIERSLLKRVGNADDIANLASFLASEDARNITGSIYVSDTGMLLK